MQLPQSASSSAQLHNHSQVMELISQARQTLLLGILGIIITTTTVMIITSITIITATATSIVSTTTAI
jgi:hypothetical protein